MVREICEDIRKISLENQLNKSQIKAISEVKKTSQEAYQHIVNNTQSSDTPKIENKKQGEKTVVESSETVQSVQHDLTNNMSVPEAAKKNGLPEP